MHGHTDTAAFNSDFSGYRLSDRKQGAGVGKTNTVYYLYINQFSDYYIMENDTANGTYRYVKGSGSYAVAFAQREDLDYDYFDQTFK